MMALLRLKNPQLLNLRNLLKEAFPYDRFAELLMLLDKNIDDFTARNTAYPTAILDSLKHANAQLWWRDLLREACNEVADPQLHQFADVVGFAPNFVAVDASGIHVLKGRNLELRIKASGTTFDIVTWRQRVAEIENRVCRVEVPELDARGTGFLVAPQLVLTNYHVIESVLKGLTAPNKVVFRFDYKVLADGVTIGSGKKHRLASDWLVDHSPYSVTDFESEPRDDADSEELDYALLRLESPAGDDAVDGTRRGWIEAPSIAHDFMQSRALYIVQHPDGKPMQVALDSEAVIKATPSRVRYTTTTEPGSSGSPCFGADWRWVALHHSGDPKYWKEGKKPEYNQGIPTETIVNLLTKRGKAQMLPPLTV
ncbi:trypsin-like peptidase domain-containing protein [Mesorhizobium sp. M0633]|uniref:trypsin-like serine peptidase n=1 Tax=Mesorhizobium sp. M0633 TaxID=2956977 RepID=UPI00333DFAAD